MIKSIVGAMALFAAFGGAWAGAPPAQADAEPRLRVDRLAGRIEIETPNRKERVAGQTLPYIRSGSIVRVRAGSAVFQSNLHATVRAGKGDVFYFMTLASERGRPVSVRFAAIEREPRELRISVGGERFRLRKGSALSVVATGPGEATVKSDWGSVTIAAGSVADDGSIRADARAMRAGQALVIAVPERAGFGDPPMSLADVNIARKSTTTYEVMSAGRAEAGSAATAGATRAVIARWPKASKAAAEAMLEKYGPANMVDAESVSWFNNGSWKTTTVQRLPSDGGDVLEQSIGYEVPEDKIALLSKLDIAVTVNPFDKELSAASESEGVNFLAINLADEVIQGKKTPADAREFYLKAVKLAESGKTSSYTQGLLRDSSD